MSRRISGGHHEPSVSVVSVPNAARWVGRMVKSGEYDESVVYGVALRMSTAVCVLHYIQLFSLVCDTFTHQ